MITPLQNISEKTYIACAKFLLSKVKSSARSSKEKGQKYGRKQKLVVSLTIEQIVQKLKDIGFRCEITGVPFPQFETAEEYKRTMLRGDVNPYFIPSIDRIDSNIYYTLDNIQIVCGPINQAKGHGKQKDFLEFINYTKTKTMKVNQNSTREQLLYFLVENNPNLATKYFESEFGVSVNVAPKQSSTYQYKKNRDGQAKSEFDKLIRAVPNVNPKMYVNISNMFRNAKGYVDNYRLITSALGTKIIKNKIEVLQTKAPRRGHIYFISKADYNTIK